MLSKGEGSHPDMTHSSSSSLAAILIAGALLISPFSTLAQQLETLNVSYASVTGSRIPLWIAKDAGLFEKYGLHVNLVVIAAGNAAIGALAGGDVEILGAPGTTTMVSAAKGSSGYHGRSSRQLEW
jgi:NitT/TauT family transport system substrate-binding protein